MTTITFTLGVRFLQMVLLMVACMSLAEGFVMDGANTTLQARVQDLESMLVGVDGRLAALEAFQSECGCKGSVAVHSAFMATMANSLEHCTKNQAVIFEDVKLNIGNGYDNRHGIFRASVAGSYAFTTTLSRPPNFSYHVAFVQNVATNEISYLYADPINMWVERSTTVLTHMAAGDEIWMVCISDSHITGNLNHYAEGAGDFHSHISGFLVGAD
ncbi:C1q-related factor-like [Mya arenaria]|nr:C1q-related factor-like [Mya arenaria]